jgi:hypothetical protein
METLVVASDHQARYYDKRTHKAFLEFLHDFQPTTGIVNGDLVDLEGLSKFRTSPSKRMSVVDDIKAGRQILEDYINASPDTDWHLTAGNHEERLENFLIDHAPELTELPGLTLEELLGVDELGVTYHGPYGAGVDWHTIHVYHGKAVSSFSSYSARKEFDINLTSGITGHTQRLGQYYFTDGRGRVHVWFEAGCMCEINPRNAPPSGRGPRQNNWQQGFVVVYWESNERWSGYTVPIVRHGFLWGGKEYSG